MTDHDLRRRLRAARAASAAAGFSLLAMLLSIAATLAPDTTPVAAATVGSAQVIVPDDGQDLVNGGKLLDSGDSSTPFSLLLPSGAACTGDSAGQDYKVFSYLVGGDIDPATLEFLGISGPLPEKYGEPLSEFRMPLIDTEGTPYSAIQTANADEEGGPGMIINLPAFGLAVYEDVANLPPGEYNAGIACWGPGSDQKLDNVWNVRLTIAADEADEGPVGIRWTADQSAAQATSVTLAVEPSGQAGEGDEVTLTATVTPTEAAGQVRFTADDDEVGTATVTEGTATLVVDDLPVGEHALRAAFTPTDPDQFAASTSPEVALEVVTAGAATTTTSTTAADDTTTTTTTPGDPGDPATTPTTTPVVAGAAFGPSTGAPLASTLPLTGGSISIGVWGALLVVFGRMAVLLGRPPTVVALGNT